MAKNYVEHDVIERYLVNTVGAGGEEILELAESIGHGAVYERIRTTEASYNDFIIDETLRDNPRWRFARVRVDVFLDEADEILYKQGIFLDDLEVKIVALQFKPWIVGLGNYGLEELAEKVGVVLSDKIPETD